MISYLNKNLPNSECQLDSTIQRASGGTKNKRSITSRDRRN